VRTNILNCAALLLSPIAQVGLAVDGQASVGPLLQPAPDNTHVLAALEPRPSFHHDRKLAGETAPDAPGAFRAEVLGRSRVPVTFKPSMDASDSTPRHGAHRIRTQSAQSSQLPLWLETGEADPIVRTNISSALGKRFGG
jgi:hypothetical protein